ncbi:MAG TPA: alkaline phosphatase family protein [Gemmatimonadales bacterium]|nr:alkaline phosphatase family protein [Gemmatimonadales bacterium]
MSIASPIAPRESPDHAPDAPDAPQSWSGAERRDRIPPAARRLLRWYYALKYRLFRREAHVPDGIRGLIVLQIDALSHADLRRALDMGYCPTISRLMDRHGYKLRRWFCGLPSATPYCQAGIFHGENAGIPAFRFYLKDEQRVVTCNAPQGVQYIRDRLHTPGALAGGSSYVNLLDGDADTVAFTVATREKTSVYARLGGTRMAVLILLHPIRVLRMAFQASAEWLLEEWARFRAELGRRRITHAEGIFPFVRILSNVVVRELQTMAILLDIYLGVPVIYSTYMQHDELAHHFGPTSRHTLSDLRRTDARIREIWRMVRLSERRDYDLVILSDHGMTPAQSYRVLFRESLGRTIQTMLDRAPPVGGTQEWRAVESYGEAGEYADMGPRVMDTVRAVMPPRRKMLRSRLSGLAAWWRQHYGIREIIMPEKYLVAAHHDVVITYSSCLALVYFAEDSNRLTVQDVLASPRRRHLYESLLAHDAIGLVAMLDADGSVHVSSENGRARVSDGQLTVSEGSNPLEMYGTEPVAIRALESLVKQHNAGDMVLFGAYDGYTIVSFDDQVGAHGSLGGDQVWPFLLTPPTIDLAGVKLEDARDLYSTVMRGGTGRESRKAADTAQEHGMAT